MAMTVVVLLILNLDVDAMTLVFLGAMLEWLFDRMIATGYCPDSCANSSRRLPAIGMITLPAA